MSNHEIALQRLVKLPAAEIKQISARLNCQQRNHKKRCEALARFLVHRHERAIANAPDESWLPPAFDEFCADWIFTNFGR